jgi:hypothetical protein
MIPAGAAHNEILLGSQAKQYVQKDLNAVWPTKLKNT